MLAAKFFQGFHLTVGENFVEGFLLHFSLEFRHDFSQFLLYLLLLFGELSLLIISEVDSVLEYTAADAQ